MVEKQNVELKLIHMEDVVSKEVEWLWYPYIPYGKITIIEGDPGEGKTTLVLKLAAALSRGLPLPCDDDKEYEPIHIIYQTAEDGIEDTIKPRLEKAGADCYMIRVIDETDNVNCGLIICGVSTIFAEESQTKMLPLIFSTEEGRRKDVPAKILASFTFTIFIFMWFVLVNLVLCWMIYGLKGFENISWMVLSQHMLQPVLFLKYLGILLGLAFQALLSLCAITLCVSAYQDSSFGAVIIAAVCWGLPVLIRMFFGGIIWLIVDSMPIFLVMTGIVNDIYEMWYIVLGINICFAIGCLVKGLVSYKTKKFA